MFLCPVSFFIDQAKQLEENLRIKASEGESFQKLLQLSEREKLELKEKFEKCVSMTSQEDKLQKYFFCFLVLYFFYKLVEMIALLNYICFFIALFYLYHEK